MNYGKRTGHGVLNAGDVAYKAGLFCAVRVATTPGGFAGKR